ncbi:hypothetical protein B0H19DRAFT_527047 [Mycena capillaripes]|nr:hypothetical protein B0H19DRAFT_527047 [Mycena capillaripes]
MCKIYIMEPTTAHTQNPLMTHQVSRLEAFVPFSAPEMRDAEEHSSGATKPNLQRGKACYNCRRRKMRCDGAQPICAQCARANRPDDCEYTYGQRRATAQILQENIKILESRISELESRPPSKRKSLHLPYQSSASSHQRNEIQRPLPFNTWSIGEPSKEVIETLIDSFLLQSSEFGFFLNPTRFRRSALLPHPIGHHSRPSPALLATVYLCGLRLSRLPSLLAQEPTFLSCALKLATQDLSSSHPLRILHTIQSEILLSYYFLASGRFLEGKYHTSTAMSLGASCYLYMVRSVSPAPPGLLEPPRDSVEEGERIRGCWILIILDNLWAIVLSQEPNVNFFNGNNRDCVFEIPWPLEERDYEIENTDPSHRYDRSFHEFLIGSPIPDSGVSTLAMLSKAAMLWQRADTLSRHWRPDMLLAQVSVLRERFRTLDAQIDGLRAILESHERLADLTIPMVRTLVVAHSVAHAATIHLHSISAVHADVTSGLKRVTSACAVLAIMETAVQQQFTFINPTMGTVWIAACQVMLEEIHALRTKRIMIDGPGEEESRLVTSLTRAVGAIGTFSEVCPLLKYQISRIQEVYSVTSAQCRGRIGES